MKRTLAIFALTLFVSGQTAFAVAPAKTRAEEQRGQVEKAEELRARVEELKEARASEKVKLEAELVTKVKAKANAEIDRITAKYDRLIARVEKMKVISDERKTEVKAKITTAKEEVIVYKEKVDAATTVKEVRTVMQELRTEVKKNSEVVKQIVAAIHASHLEGVVEKLTTILEKLEAKDADAAKITIAKAQLTEATGLIEDGELKTAKEKILEARKTMVEIAQEVKVSNAENSDEKEGTE